MGLLTDIIMQDRQKKQSEKDAQANLYLSAIKGGQLAPGPNDTDEQKAAKRQQLDYALDQYGKLSGASKEHKNLLNKVVGGVYDKIHGGGAGKSQLASPSGSQPEPQAQQNTDDPGAAGQQLSSPPGSQPTQPAAAAPQQAAEGRSRLPSPPPPQKPSTPPQSGLSGDFAQAAFPNPQATQQAEDTRQQGMMQAERDRRLKLADNLQLSSRDKAEFSETGKLPASGAALTGNRKAEQWELPDGSKVDVDYDPKSGVRYSSNGDIFEVPEGAKRASAPKGSNQLRQLKYAVTIDDAQKRAADGATFKDVEGKDIDLSKLPANNVLEAMETGDGKIVYTPMSPTESTFTVGNRVYARTPFNSALTGTPAQNAPIDLGQARTGSSGTTAQLAVDPVTNKLTVNTLPHTTLPASPGARPAGAQQQSPQPASPPEGNARQPLSSPAGTATQPQGKQDTGGATLRGAPVGMFNQQSQKAVPLMESVSQVFGDPKNPELKGLLSYADMADDPKSKERLGKALKLTFDGLADATGGANVSVGAGPVNVSAGGFGQWLQNAVGIPQSVAAQHAKIMQDAIKDLTPQEREAYDAEMTAFSTAVGLRSLTKASAAQGSVRAIERELPLIGVNTASKKQFYDQMQRLAELSINGIRTFPNVNGSPVGFDKGLADRINGMPAELQKLKNGTPMRGLGKPPKAGDVEDGYRFKGGDPKKKENWEPVKGKAAA